MNEGSQDSSFQTPTDLGTSPQNNLEASAKKEKGMPHIAIELHLGPHRTADDIKNLQHRIGQADIYSPEVNGWKPELLQAFQEVSDGRTPPVYALEHAGVAPSHPHFKFLLAELHVINGLKKPIIFLDPPNEEAASKGVEPEFMLWWGASYTRALESVREYIKNAELTHQPRYDYVFTHLPANIARVLNAYPVLKEKKEVHVLLSRGYLHATDFLGEELDKAKYSFTRTYSKTPFIFDYESEGRLRFSMSKRIDDDLAGRILMQRLLFRGDTLKKLNAITGDTAKIMAFTRKVIAGFTIDEIKAAHESHEPVDTLIYIKDKFTMPKSEAELDQLLAA